MKGASGRYAGWVVNETGTVIGRVSAVAGRTPVASTTPGRMLPPGEPMPGKFDAAPKRPPPPPVGGPSVAFKPGKPKRVPRAPGVSPKVPAEPPVNGNWTNGWLKAGRKSDRPAIEPTSGPDGARMMAGGLPSRVELKKSCEFGR